MLFNTGRMGKVHSILRLSGKVGDYVYYTLHGKKVVRKAAQKRRGPKTEGEKARTLQNSEFGKAAAAGKALRGALAEECRKLHDRYLYQRVNRLMPQLRSCDEAAAGSRTAAGGLATAAGQELLACFLFHKKRVNFPRLLKATRQRGTLLLQYKTAEPMPATLLEVQINFKNGAFRRHEHPFPQGLPDGAVTVKRKFRSKKGFTDLLLISGKGFLQGVVITP